MAINFAMRATLILISDPRYATLEMGGMGAEMFEWLKGLFRKPKCNQVDPRLIEALERAREMSRRRRLDVQYDDRRRQTKRFGDECISYNLPYAVAGSDMDGIAAASYDIKYDAIPSVSYTASDTGGCDSGSSSDGGSCDGD